MRCIICSNSISIDCLNWQPSFEVLYSVFCLTMGSGDHNVCACLSASIDEVFREADALNRKMKHQNILGQLSEGVVKNKAFTQFL